MCQQGHLDFRPFDVYKLCLYNPPIFCSVPLGKGVKDIAYPQ